MKGGIEKTLKLVPPFEKGGGGGIFMRRGCRHRHDRYVENRTLVREGINPSPTETIVIQSTYRCRGGLYALPRGSADYFHLLRVQRAE